MSKRKFFTIAFTGYFFYTGIVAYVGSSLAHLIGITEALSVIGAVFVVALGWWLWNEQKKKKVVP
jgi:membrane protein DedA with SNARE-associated domain